MNAQNANRIAFWFPVILPVVVGLVYGFAQFSAEMTASGYIISIVADPAYEDLATAESGIPYLLQTLIQTDLLELWAETSKGIVTAVFSIHVWALSTLFSAAHKVRQSAVFAYPVVGIFTNFFLVSIIVATTNIATSLQNVEGTPAAPGMLFVSTLAAVVAVMVGWFVRRGVWIHYESLL